jgi:primosomal protein N' (replication factor Y)
VKDSVHESQQPANTTRPDNLEASGGTLFCEVMLPIPLAQYFTYRVPRDLQDEIEKGQRVIVPFGDRKILTGIVMSLHTMPPKAYEAKYVLEVLDPFPVVSDQQLRLFQWMASYYLCTQGEVMNAALPSGLKLSSESIVQLYPNFDLEQTDQPFSEKELLLLTHLHNAPMSYSAISELLGIKNIYSIIKSLVAKEAIILFEQIKEKYKPKTERRVRLVKEFTDSETLESLFESLATKPKQEAVLLKYLQLVPVMHDRSANRHGVARKDLLGEGVSASSLATLIRNGVFEDFNVTISRVGGETEAETPHVQLSAEQKQAHAGILEAFAQQPVTLLRGITGSGKTEIYVNLIRQALDGGSQVLYMLPEIALTTQIVRRLQKIFGGAMGVYHSRFSDAERVEVWKGIQSGTFRFIVGVRSSVLLPFDNLGLIIVDEEHDPSYKQQDPAPRYHARDAAVMLGQIHHAKVLLGSATPSMESHFLAQHGKYAFVKLDKRFGEARLPEVLIADMTKERKAKTVKGEFSMLMLNSIAQTLDRGEQVIIFQNRRGYSPMMMCDVCHWVPKCINCSVSLTYHSYRNALVCHYCGYRETTPTACPTCSSTRLKTVGYGTEKLEEELKVYFPEAHIQRMDLDTTRTKKSHETILEDFEQGNTHILVGTQMVTKGLDFDKVGMVGIFNADRMMHFPDFRSHERAFQLITQVSGRAGRRDVPGRVVIQTSHPDHPLLQMVLRHDVDGFYNYEISERAKSHFPPFTRLVEIIVKHSDRKVCHACAGHLFDLFRQHLSDVRIMGPAEPIIARIRNQYLMTILVKIPRGYAGLQDVKLRIQDCVATILKEKEYRNARVVLDVDPV